MLVHFLKRGDFGHIDDVAQPHNRWVHLKR
jgi:hypothetical protein